MKGHASEVVLDDFYLDVTFRSTSRGFQSE